MRVRSILVFLIFASPLFAQFRLRVRNPEDLYAEQRRTVGTWCRQDFEGLRLTPNGWERFKPITNQRNNPDTSVIAVISRYQIEQRDSQAVSWNLDVTYTVLGRYERGSGYIPSNGTETVTFRTKDVDGQIVITDVEPAYPHLSRKAALDWMKLELAAATSDIDKFHLASAIKMLEPPAASAAAQPAK